ncbi:MAG: hypothetical protein WCC27_15450 [Acidobacteriaceae bacterium]
MKFACTLFFGALIAAAMPALAQTTINSPTNGAEVTSPFTLNMTASTCSSLAVSAVGYSLDSSSQTSAWNADYIDGPVGAPAGWHTLHVKVWNYKGAVCVTDISIDVVTGGSASTSSGGGALSLVPSSAVSVSAIQALGGWQGVHDTGTSGSSSGTMSMASSPSLTGAARLFANQFNDYGGERYWEQFSDDTSATNFLYDTWVYIAGNANGIANLEFDLEQTMPNGQTALMGFQCDGWAQRWDYAVNGGSPTAPKNVWLHSYAPCNVHSWSANQWHHVQIYFSRNSSNNGWVTYHSVWLDGAEQNLNLTYFSGYALGWGPAIVANFQIDGNSSGTTWGNVYMDELRVYRW